MPLSDSKLLFWNGKTTLKSIHFDAVTDKDHTEQPAAAPTATPSLCGVPLKYISYVIHLSPHGQSPIAGLCPFLVLWLTKPMF